MYLLIIYLFANASLIIWATYSIDKFVTFHVTRFYMLYVALNVIWRWQNWS